MTRNTGSLFLHSGLLCSRCGCKSCVCAIGAGLEPSVSQIRTIRASLAYGGDGTTVRRTGQWCGQEYPPHLALMYFGPARGGRSWDILRFSPAAWQAGGRKGVVDHVESRAAGDGVHGTPYMPLAQCGKCRGSRGHSARRAFTTDIISVPPSGGLRPRKRGTPNRPYPRHADHQISNTKGRTLDVSAYFLAALSYPFPGTIGKRVGFVPDP